MKILVIGILIGAGLMFFFYKSTYLNHTAEEWYSLFENTNNDVSNLIRCVNNITPLTSDTSSLNPLIPKSEINRCLDSYRSDYNHDVIDSVRYGNYRK